MRFIILLINIFFVLSHINIACRKESNGIDTIFDILNSGKGADEITVIDFILDHKRSYITYITDKAANIFLIKQSRLHDPGAIRGPLIVVREMLGAYIAESNGIPANKVRMIPAGYAIPGKLYLEFPATLHTLVQGKPVSNIGIIFIQQPWKGYIPKEKWGLSYRVIHDMSLHPDLPLIVAFDTFIGNAARRSSSYFYDEKLNRFWAIDLESSFGKDLCALACEFFSTILHNKRGKFTSQEVNGLSIYCNTLKKLIKNHPPHMLHEKLDQFAWQAGIKPGSFLFNDTVEREIERYKKNISQCYVHAQRLVVLLDELIASHP